MGFGRLELTSIEMDSAVVTLPEDLFSRANTRCHHRAYKQWQRGQSKQHIL